MIHYGPVDYELELDITTNAGIPLCLDYSFRQEMSGIEGGFKMHVLSTPKMERGVLNRSDYCIQWSLS